MLGVVDDFSGKINDALMANFASGNVKRIVPGRRQAVAGAARYAGGIRPIRRGVAAFHFISGINKSVA